MMVKKIRRKGNNNYPGERTSLTLVRKNRKVNIESSGVRIVAMHFEVGATFRQQQELEMGQRRRRRRRRRRKYFFLVKEFTIYKRDAGTRT